MFLRYLVDYREHLESQLLHQWRSGGPMGEEKVVLGRVIACTEMVQMTLADVQHFYGVEQTGTEG